MADPTLLCIDCKNCVGKIHDPLTFNDWICEAPENRYGLNPVNGEKLYHDPSPTSHRSWHVGSPNRCTIAGIWFDPR